MIKNTVLIIFKFFMVFFVYSQNCPNSNFSNLNFNNWTGTTGTTPYQGLTPYSIPGFVTGQHTIISTPGFDPNTNGVLSMLPPGGSTSCMLGNAINGYGAESMTYQMLVDNTNNLFVYEYAMILQDPQLNPHSIAEKPRFIVKVMDVNNNIISGNCSFYETYGGDPNNNFNSAPGEITYSNWKKVAIDLSSYINNDIKIQFTTMDCDLGGHWGYAYLSTSCRTLSIDMVKNCDGTVVLTAPPGFHSYLWSGGQQTQSITLNNPPTGTYTYSCTMNAIAGLSCPSQIDTTFDYIAKPTISINNDTICIGETTTISSTCNEVGGTYTWLPGGQTTSSISVSPTTATNYIISYNALNNCTYNDTATITVDPLPVFSVQDVSVCMDHSITLNPIPTNLTYTWDNGVLNNVPFIPLVSNTYTVTAQDPITGCIDEKSIFVTVNPNPKADFTFVCGSLPASFTNTSVGGISYYWNMGDGEQLQFLQDIEYNYYDLEKEIYSVTLTAINEFGCNDSITQNFITPFLHYVPNTFTPDNNEFNNDFTPIFSQKNRVDDYLLTIYNRWGEIVFKSYDIKQGWDGMYNKEKAKEGTYNWEILYNESRCYNRRLHFYGHVNLIR